MKMGPEDLCDPWRAAKLEQWELGCTGQNQTNVTDLVPGLWTDGREPEKNWFMCEADTDMAEFHRNMSSAGIVAFRVKAPDALGSGSGLRREGG